MLSFAIIAQATIINVDNKPNRPSGYISNLTLAINNASAGDTIYVYPSNVSYGNVTITKKLYLFGFGYDGTTGYNSKIDYLYLDTTSSPSSNPSGTTIQGFNIIIISSNKANIKNISITGNYITNRIELFSGGNSNNSGWIIKNNYLESNILVYYNTSLIISNNVFRSDYYAIRYSNSSSVIISHNLFMNWIYFDNVQNATVSNNIFICNTSSYTGGSMNNNTFTNNISFCSNSSYTYTLPPTGNTGTGNKQNQNPVFVTGSTSGAYDISLDYHLQASSPGKNAGTDGTDIGPYGGTKPFVWGGAFSIPKVTQMTISNPIINSGTNINVNVKAKKAEL